MKDKNLGSSKAEFAAALQEYIEGDTETALLRSYELGRRALGEGMGLLDMAEVQHGALRALRAVERPGWPEPNLRQMEACRRCFLEALSVFEMAHRGFRDANAVLRHFNEALEAEIKRVGHVVHGQIGQLLAAISLEFNSLQPRPGADSDRHLLRVKDLLALVEDQLRHLVHEIRPTVLDDLGLVPAIEFLREGVEKRSSLRVLVRGSLTQRYPQAVEITMYRIVQEALNNVIKHARASQVTVHVKPEGKRLACSIRDDGVGFDVSSLDSTNGERGFGLMGMRERLQRVGGTLEIHSAPGSGTELTVLIHLVN